MKKSLKFYLCVSLAAVMMVSGCSSHNEKEIDTVDIPSVEEYESSVLELHFELDTEEKKSSDSNTSSDTEEENDSDFDTASDENTDSGTDSASDNDTERETDTDTASDTDTDSGNESYEIYSGEPILILVNKDNPVPAGYQTELTTLSNGIMVDSRAYPDLQEMFDTMRAEGIYPVVVEGYRTYEYQQEVMQNRINGYIAEGYSEEDAKAEAEKWVAVPGTSEHELGLAIDIGGASPWDVYNWLAENAYKFGFILRYPEGRESVTGIDYEPWHYRFVGREAAEEIYKSGLCLEEYVKYFR